MDFMKVFDQTVREIKREVNLKVLKVPEIEQKVLDATDDEPWGPHGTVLAEIAQATKKFSECQMVMNVLWTRLTETGKNWRFVYKSLAVIEYLVANGSERAVDDIIEHTFQISALSSFEYVEPSGKDLGINVRKKVETIVALLNNKDKIQDVRNKAATTRDKYFGLSSTGITYKSGSASLGTTSSRGGDRYGGFGSTRDGEALSDSYKDRDQGEDKFVKSTNKPRRGDNGDTQENTLKKGSSRHTSGQATYSASESMSKNSQSSNAPSNDYEDSFDDFDPRGTSSSSKSAAGSSHEADIFGQSLIGDLLDAPVSVPAENLAVNSSLSDVDLFADATFVSASSNAAGGNIDLFAAQPTSSSAVSSTMDLFTAPDPVPAKAVDPFTPQLNNKFSEPVQVATNVVDPFAAMPLNSFDSSDPFGSFTSHVESAPKEPYGATDNNSNGKSQTESKTPPKKDPFQVKSGIWADSLSRGLIDLNISAPKKVNLADVGVVGGLTEADDSAKAHPTSYYMGRAMGTRSGLGISGFTPTAAGEDDLFSSLGNQQQYQFGVFQK